MTLEEKINCLSIDQAKQMLYDIIKESYTLIGWPKCQTYMEEPWFDNEAILALGSEEITGSSAYFIPTRYIIK